MIIFVYISTAIGHWCKDVAVSQKEIDCSEVDLQQPPKCSANSPKIM